MSRLERLALSRDSLEDFLYLCGRAVKVLWKVLPRKCPVELAQDVNLKRISEILGNFKCGHEVLHDLIDIISFKYFNLEALFFEL